jgi:hypothetical protein
MPLYFFNIEEDGTYQSDQRGEPFPDLAAAQSFAYRLAYEMLQFGPRPPEKLSVIVTDEKGEGVFELSVPTKQKDEVR